MNAPATQVYGAGGAPLALGPQLGRGGEGAVYGLSATEAAKIYTAPPARGRIEKLEALVRVQTPELASIAAWPRELVLDRRRAVVGFTMPRIEGRVSLATAMNPGSRKARFPHANWAWLAHVAQNLAAAIETVHRANVVLGDVNDSNFLVGSDTLVRVIDIDSFQVRHYARVLTCDVGVPTYQPPELQGKSFSGLRRSVEHDRFGLAVLIFQLLFMGRHPWAGVREGPEIAFDTGEVIAKLPFAFGRDAAARGFRPPPNTVRLDWLTPGAANAFERAFSGRPLGRPTAAEWVATLQEFESQLARCTSSPVHRYLPSQGACPWCDLERRGIFLFVTEASSAFEVVYLDVAEIEKRLAEIPPLQSAPLPVDPSAFRERGEPLPSQMGVRRNLWRAAAVAAAIAAVAVAVRLHGAEPELPADAIGALVLYRTRPALGRVRRERRLALEAAEREYFEVCEEWRRVADMTPYARERATLVQKLDAYRKLPAKYAAERARLETDKAHHQLRAFLATFLLEEAKIEGIGRKRRETLAAYGIETALDVEELLPGMDVPGIGGVKRTVLAMWVNALRSRFRYDPTRPLDPSLRNEIQARENRERSDLERDLRGGPQALRAAVEAAFARREALLPKLHATARAVAKAYADVQMTEGF